MRQGHGVDFRPPEDEDLACVGRPGQCLLPGVDHLHPLGRVVGAAGQDDGAPLGEGTAQAAQDGLVGLASQDDRVAHRERPQAAQVGAQAPGEVTSASDHPVVGDRGDDGEAHDPVEPGVPTPAVIGEPVGAGRHL